MTRSLNQGQKAMVVAKALLLSNTSKSGGARAAEVNRTRVSQAATVLAHAPDLAEAE